MRVRGESGGGDAGDKGEDEDGDDADGEPAADGGGLLGEGEGEGDDSGPGSCVAAGASLHSWGHRLSHVLGPWASLGR